MYWRNDVARREHDREQLNSSVVRSYQEIARILTEREGRPVTPAEVRRICRAAERKLAHVARSEPVIDHWLRPCSGSARSSNGPGTSAGVDRRKARHPLPRIHLAAIRGRKTDATTRERLTENRCVFQVCCAAAQQVKLVIDHCDSVPRIFSLHLRGDGVWETVLDLDPGEHRYCYYAYDGRSLTYLVPADARLEGLKAVLRVGEACQLETRS